MVKHRNIDTGNGTWLWTLASVHHYSVFGSIYNSLSVPFFFFFLFFSFLFRPYILVLSLPIPTSILICTPTRLLVISQVLSLSLDDGQYWSSLMDSISISTRCSAVQQGKQEGERERESPVAGAQYFSSRFERFARRRTSSARSLACLILYTYVTVYIIAAKKRVG